MKCYHVTYFWSRKKENYFLEKKILIKKYFSLNSFSFFVTFFLVTTKWRDGGDNFLKCSLSTPENGTSP
jgi:hypothetical protein